LRNLSYENGKNLAEISKEGHGSKSDIFANDDDLTGI
jgi:hypothetical protein